MIARSLLAAALLAGATPCPAAAAQSFAAGRQTMYHGGIERSYVVRADFDRARAARVPLVLVLHGGGGNAANAENMTGFTEKARREGFIVVYPEGTGRTGDQLLTWNAVHCCAYAMKNHVDDVGFIRALIDKLRRSHPIDPRRVYVTGMSNGAMMSHRLGIELSDRIAAIAPVVGTVFGDEPRPAQGVPALMINGMLDENVPWQGGAPGGRGARGWDGTPARPALEQATFWAAANGCKPEADQSETAHWLHWSYACPTPRAVQLYLLKDNGHAWPGGRPGSRRGDVPSDSLNATDLIWEFFRAQSQ
jgi:polyhydroxybutyrate depolymerase